MNNETCDDSLLWAKIYADVWEALRGPEITGADFSVPERLLFEKEHPGGEKQEDSCWTLFTPFPVVVSDGDLDLRETEDRGHPELESVVKKVSGAVLGPTFLWGLLESPKRRLKRSLFEAKCWSYVGYACGVLRMQAELQRRIAEMDEELTAMLLQENPFRMGEGAGALRRVAVEDSWAVARGVAISVGPIDTPLVIRWEVVHTGSGVRWRSPDNPQQLIDSQTLKAKLTELAQWQDAMQWQC